MGYSYDTKIIKLYFSYEKMENQNMGPSYTDTKTTKHVTSKPEKLFEKLLQWKH